MMRIRNWGGVICWLLILWFVFSILIPALIHLPIIGEPLDSVVHQTHFALAIQYGGYFLLGHYLVKSHNSLFERYAMFYLIIGILATVLGTLLISVEKGHTSELFYDYFFPTTFLSSIGVFLLIKKWFTNRTPSKVVQVFMRFIAICSLGIYAVHMFFLVAFHHVGLTCVKYNAFVAIPVITIICLALSCLVAYCLKKYLPFGKSVI